MKPILIAACCAIAAIAASAAPAPAAASKWDQAQLSPNPHYGNGTDRALLTGVSCPSPSFCVAVGALNTLAFSRSPGTGAGWQTVDPPYPVGPGKTCVEGEPGCHQPGGRLRAVSCPTESFCAFVSYEGFVYVSTDPTGGAGAWSPTVLREAGNPTHLVDVSCPSPSFCAAVTGGFRADGRVLTSTDPAGGSWTATDLPGELDLRGIDCGTPSLCVAVARGGRLFGSTDPAGGTATWRYAGTPGGGGDLDGVDCVGVALCAAGNLAGNILTSAGPTEPGAVWSEADTPTSVLITDVSCPDDSHCVAVDNNGDVLTSSAPTAHGSWTFENLQFFPETDEGEPPHNAFFGASCPSASFCALVGSKSRIFTSRDPFALPAKPVRRRAKRRPRTVLMFSDYFWRRTVTRRHRVRAHFRFYSRQGAAGFECRRDRGRFRRCRSPLRYWVGRGRHALRVRAIGETGERGPVALARFRVERPARRPLPARIGGVPGQVIESLDWGLWPERG